MGWRLNFITMGFCLIAISSMSVMSVISVLANPASQLLLNQGERAIKRTAYKEAIRFCEQAIVADPADASAFACLGRGHMKNGSKEGAEKYYKIALAISPTHQRALGWSGEADIANGRPDKARAKLRRLKRVCGQCAAYKQLRKALLQHDAKKSSSKKNKP